MRPFQRRYGLLSLPVVLWLSLNSVQAAPNITCSAGMNTTAGSTGTINLGTITPANADSSSINGTLNYSCTNSGDAAAYVSVCLGAGSGDIDTTSISPRYMKSGSTDTSHSKLAFTMTLEGGVLWGSSSNSGSEYQSAPFLVADGATVTASTSITTSLLPNYGNTLATPNSYVSAFDGGHTVLTFDSSADGTSLNCLTTNQTEHHFPFNVQATVASSCQITATSDIHLGSYSAGVTNITGHNNQAISVTCTNSTPYTIGLTPSNDDMTGAGIMTGTGNNKDQVPYQLLSNAEGTIWGSITTDGGNGVKEIGNGTPQTKVVYVSVPNTDVTPDSYSDTVTIRVNY